ncbi:MAG TPA: DNA topoisomerase I [Candidatus Bathyarchaeia archaeon]|nr:DNA topoisomerase I [Candidatus Bathyarchaeia archaeon]
MLTTLIITEKPDAALHVANALGTQSQVKKMTHGGVPFFEVQTSQERILVCSALGHLYAVAAKTEGKRSQYPVWDLSWKPKHLVQRGQVRQERWIRSISELSKEANQFISACDYDLEGSVIGYTILKYACNGADQKARRMKFSTLTPKDLRDAYSKLLPRLDFELAFAGMCRHEVDWLFGINLSRALTQSALKASHRYSTLSTGRVQGPTMRFVVEREQEIQCFVPTPYWVMRCFVEVDGKLLEAELEIERLDTETSANRVMAECAGKIGTVEKIESHTYNLQPPTPFDLSTLQAEAYRHFGLTPRITLGIAERAYLDQLISYPRTSSQKLPPTIGYREILEGLSKLPSYRKETAKILAAPRLMPQEGRKEDPAHPAVYPTGILPSRQLESKEQKLFDLVTRRFLATFGQPAARQSDKAIIRVGQYHFFLRGARILFKGWIEFYGRYAKFDEITLPPLKEGQPVAVKEIRVNERYTQPPPRYNPSSLLKSMEDMEIGTKATRADIVQTLYERAYVKEDRRMMMATPLALCMNEILMKYCPKIIDVRFTRELETMMKQIEDGKETREHVVHATIQYLKPILEDLKTKEEEIGTRLTTTIREMWTEKITLSVLCPKCQQSLIQISSKNGKRFIGHKTISDCKFSLPLPPTRMADLALTPKLCPECGFQTFQIKWKGRRLSRPILSCPNCYVKKAQESKEVKAAMNPLQEVYKGSQS